MTKTTKAEINVKIVGNIVTCVCGNEAKLADAMVDMLVASKGIHIKCEQCGCDLAVSREIKDE